MSAETHSQVERQLSQLDPEIELVAVQSAGPDTLRVYIDHPDGVDLALCERVTGALGELRERYSLEVSSPGANRPLTRPEHFRRYLGRQAKIRTSVEVEGRRGFTGTIAAATDTSVELTLPEGSVRIPHESIHRSNLVPETA